MKEKYSGLEDINLDQIGDMTDPRSRAGVASLRNYARIMNPDSTSQIVTGNSYAADRIERGYTTVSGVEGEIYQPSAYEMREAETRTRRNK